MNLEKVKILLQECKFIEVKTNVEEVTLHYKEMEGINHLLMLCNFKESQMPEPNQIRHMIWMASLDGRFGRGMPYPLVLIFTWNMAYARNLVNSGVPAWIVDRNTNNLIIYEEQPDEFAGIKKPLEVLLREEKIERRPSNSQVTLCNTIIVAINILVFFVMRLAEKKGGGNSFIQWGALYMPYMDQPKEFYRLFTAMFLHFDMAHLSSNMIILFALGDNLERALGKVRYVLLYIGSGVGASILSCIYNRLLDRAVVAAGASGAIFGVIGALFYLTIKNKGRLEELTMPRMGLMILYILYSGFSTPGIDNAAHIGGLLTGFFMAFLIGSLQKYQ
ncbi:MAG: rhomboid family intramembrane serine protease [Lachnospiraceae bacterium]|nr:rhomboid family intramembrane serine protease [Lachnospiraceae bacterium]